MRLTRIYLQWRFFIFNKTKEKKGLPYNREVDYIHALWHLLCAWWCYWFRWHRAVEIPRWHPTAHSIFVCTLCADGVDRRDIIFNLLADIWFLSRLYDNKCLLYYYDRAAFSRLYHACGWQTSFLYGDQTYDGPRWSLVRLRGNDNNNNSLPRYEKRNRSFPVNRWLQWTLCYVLQYTDALIAIDRHQRTLRKSETNSLKKNNFYRCSAL